MKRTPLRDLTTWLVPEPPICEFLPIDDDVGQLSITVPFGAKAFDAEWLVLPVTGFGRDGEPMVLRFQRVATTRMGAMFVLRSAVGGMPVEGEG